MLVLGHLGDLIETSTRIAAFPYTTAIDSLYKTTRIDALKNKTRKA